MSRLGDKARTYRLPTIINGALTYKTLELDRGRWVAVCFVPKLGVIEADLLERYATDVELLGATLVLVSMDAGRWPRDSFASLPHVRIPVVGDPLGRLQRLFGGATARSWGRARTFLLDPDGHFRFHLMHSLSERGMGVFMELLRTYQDEEVPA